MVERVLLGEEVLQPRIAGEHGLVEEPDVAARAEGAEGALPLPMPRTPTRSTRGSSRKASSAAVRSRIMSSESAFSALGRSSVTSPHCPGSRHHVRHALCPPADQFVRDQRADHQRTSRQHRGAGRSPAPSQASRIRRSPPAGPAARSPAPAARGRSYGQRAGNRQLHQSQHSQQADVVRRRLQGHGQRQRHQRRDRRAHQHRRHQVHCSPWACARWVMVQLTWAASGTQSATSVPARPPPSSCVWYM